MNNSLCTKPSHFRLSPNKPYHLDKPPKCNQGDKPDNAWTWKTCTHELSRHAKIKCSTEGHPGFQALGLLRSLAYLSFQGNRQLFRIFPFFMVFRDRWVSSFPSRVVKSRSAARAAAAPGLDCVPSIERPCFAVEIEVLRLRQPTRYPSQALQFCRPGNEKMMRIGGWNGLEGWLFQVEVRSRCCKRKNTSKDFSAASQSGWGQSWLLAIKWHEGKW